MQGSSRHAALAAVRALPWWASLCNHGAAAFAAHIRRRWRTQIGNPAVTNSLISRSSPSAKHRKLCLSVHSRRTAATIRGVQGLIDWITQVPPLVGIAVLTFLPLLELRASIPYGLLATTLPWWVVFIAAVVTNWLVAPFVYLFLKYALRFLTRNAWFARVWERYSERTQMRISRTVDTWGAWGLAVFIGIPLPGSGVYTGALGAYLLGMGFRRFMWVALAGVLIAAITVTIIVMTGVEACSWMYSTSALDPH